MLSCEPFTTLLARRMKPARPPTPRMTIRCASAPTYVVCGSAFHGSPLVRSAFPGMCRALNQLANVRVRNVATLGGNLAHADPHMDLPALLTALEASIVVQGAAGTRTLPIGELISGYMETTLAGSMPSTGAPRLPRYGAVAVRLGWPTRPAARGRPVSA